MTYKADIIKDPEGWFGEKFVRFAQMLFEERPEGELRWDPDPKVSEILITDAIPAPVEELELRPIIQITIEGYQSAGLTIDQRLWEDPYTGERIHFDLFQGQATYQIIAKLDETAKRLSKVLAFGLLEQKRTLMKMAKLQNIGQVVSRGPMSPPGSFVKSFGDVDGVMCTVSFPFFFTRAWKTKPQRVFEEKRIDPPKVKKIEIALSSPTLRYKGKIYQTKKILD